MTNSNPAVILHYNSKQPINCRIKGQDVKHFFSAELPGGVSLIMSKGDPIVIGSLSKGVVELQGGSIVSVNALDGIIRNMILLADSKPVAAERRKAERLYTSLFGIVSKNNMIVSDIYIKDISEIGICIYADADFDVDEQVEVDIILLEEVGRFKCTVARKMNRYGKKVYGLKIIQDDESLPTAGRFVEGVKTYYDGLEQILKERK